MSDIEPMKRIVTIPLKGGRMDRPAEVMNLIRMEIYSVHTKTFAEACGVSTGCIYAIRRGKTKWPRGMTLFSILTELGYEIRVVKS